MGKGIYAKPLMKIEQFTPNESVAVCWRVPKGSCYSSLYKDNHGEFGNGGPDGFWNPWGDDERLQYNHDQNHTVVPADSEWFKTEKPENINDNQTYYDYPDNYLIKSNFHAQITTPIFQVVAYERTGTTILGRPIWENVTHYCQTIEESGHS